MWLYVINITCQDDETKHHRLRSYLVIVNYGDSKVQHNIFKKLNAVQIKTIVV